MIENKQKSEPESDETWIEWFCKQKGHELLCEITPDFFMNEENLAELNYDFKDSKAALNVISNYESMDGLSDGELETINLEKKRIALQEAK